MQKHLGVKNSNSFFCDNTLITPHSNAA